MQANTIAQAVLFACLLTAASVWDLCKQIIPDSICLLMALSGLIDFSPVRFLGIFAALPLFIAAVCKPGSVGGGDIKLCAAAGMVMGFGGCMTGLMLGLIVAIVFYLFHQIARKLRKLQLRKAFEASLPMAPFLSLGFLAIAIINTGG